MKNLIPYLKLTLGDRQHRLSLGLIALTLLGLVFISTGKSQEPAPAAPMLDSDEMIPEGSVLVPLDLQNREALNDLVGAFAIVDLFTVSPDGRMKGTKVGKRVKLIRPPQNPTQFSALVPEDQAPLLFSNPGPLFAVIQSRQGRKAGSVIDSSKKSSRIRVFSGGQK